MARRLHALEPPWIHVTEATAPAFTHWSRAMARDEAAVVRLLRGGKMRSWTGLLDEIAPALDLPRHLGDSLAALNELLRDLSWLPAKRYLVAIADAGEVLREVAPEDLSVFLYLLHDVARGWARPAPPQGALVVPEPRPFHVVLQEQGARVAALETRVLQAGVMVDLLDLIRDAGPGEGSTYG